MAAMMSSVAADLEARLVKECCALRQRLDLSAIIMEPGSDDPVALQAADGRIWHLASEVVPPEGNFQPVTVAIAIESIERCLTAIAVREASTIIESVSALIPGNAERNAIIARLCCVWPWSEESSSDEAVCQARSLLPTLHRMSLAAALGAHFAPSVAESWPSDIALRDAVDWIVERLEADKRGSAKQYRSVCYGEIVPTNIATNLAPESSALTLQQEYEKQRGGPWITRPWGTFLGDSNTFASGEQLSWIYSQVRALERDRSLKSVVMPSHHRARSVTSMLVSPASDRERNKAFWTSADLVDDRVVLYWEGRREPLQLHLLSNDGETLNQAIAYSMIANLGEDALRDWIGLHQLAGDQGGTGEFRWSWREHKERAGYQARIRNSSQSEESLAIAARRRLHRLDRAHLWVERPFDENGEKKLKRIHVGAPYGLISIGGEILKGDHRTPELIAGRINSALYRENRDRVALFTQLPANITELPIEELRMITMLAYCWRAGKGSELGQARLKAKTLWQYAGWTEARWKERRRWPALRNQTERILKALSKKHEIDWEGGGLGPRALYEIRAPAWWRDRIVYGVKALLSPSTANVARTVAELEATRKERGLSMRQLASVLGVNAATVSRLAAGNEQVLPPEWLPKLAAAKLFYP